MAEEELYDIILKVPSNGIHSPWNLHAFRSLIVFLPTKCTMCERTVYPLTRAAVCVRCGCYVHRTCTRKDAHICEKFLLGPGQAGSGVPVWGVAGSLVDNSSTAKVKRNSTTKQVIQVAPKVINARSPLLDRLGLQSLLDGAPIPPPGSEGCIWRQALRLISSDYRISRIASIPPHHHAVQKITYALLRDAQSFPGRVSAELRELYMTLSFGVDKDFLLHARELLDNVACAVLAILPQDIYSDSERLKAVVTTVDWKVLRHNDGSMYDKVWGAAQRLGARMDSALLSRLQHQQSCDVDLEATPRFSDIQQRLGRVPCEYTVMDKLKRVVQALKYVAASASTCSHDDPGEAPEGASLEQTMQDLNVDADSLMQRFCDIIAQQTLKFEFYWHAECIYIEFMCRESSWLLGAEGYALVTLQQALRSLCPTAAIMSAAQNDVELKIVSPAPSVHAPSDDGHSETASVSSTHHTPSIDLPVIATE